MDRRCDGVRRPGPAALAGAQAAARRPVRSGDEELTGDGHTVGSSLVEPHTRFHRSFLEAVDEFVVVGEERHAGLAVFGCGGVLGPEFTRDAIAQPAGFAAMVGVLTSAKDAFAPRPRGYVPWTELWLADGDEYLGRITLRHELTDALLTWGGHIGYAVRPSARRRGLASAALRQMLDVAHDRNIDPVLVTCDVDNVASRRVIEGAGGEYEDTREGKRRYWIATSPR